MAKFNVGDQVQVKKGPYGKSIFTVSEYLGDIMIWVDLWEDGYLIKNNKYPYGIRMHESNLERDVSYV